MAIASALYNPISSLFPSSPVNSTTDNAASKTKKSKGQIDRELVKRIQTTTGKDRDYAFAALYTRHRGTAYSAALKITQNQDEIEEIIQEAFVKVHRNIDKFRGDSAFTTWLHRIVTNAALNYKAFEKRRVSPISMEQTGVSESMESVNPSPHTPSGDSEAEELKRHLDEGLSSLRGELREALLLATQSNMSYKDISKITGVPVGTVRSRVFRARQSLAEYMSSRLPDFREGSSRIKT